MKRRFGAHKIDSSYTRTPYAHARPIDLEEWVRSNAMSASKESLYTSVRGGGSGARISARAAPCAVRIPCNVPAPEHWTLVREVNMEKREPCEVE